MSLKTELLMEFAEMPEIVEIVPSVACCDKDWERAYRRFETPEQEIQKFIKRLKRAGAIQWDRDQRVVDLFCGRGNGLVALEKMGFRQLAGVDLSRQLLQEYKGIATCYVADCRQLPFADESREIVIVQGGLHHLPTLPGDLQLVLREIHRILAPRGKVFIVEPWLTPFLRIVHWICDRRLARRLAPKLDAFAVMAERERNTYENWLGRPHELLSVIQDAFDTRVCKTRLGKLFFVGEKRPLR